MEAGVDSPVNTYIQDAVFMVGYAAILYGVSYFGPAYPWIVGGVGGVVLACVSRLRG